MHAQWKPLHIRQPQEKKSTELKLAIDLSSTKAKRILPGEQNSQYGQAKKMRLAKEEMKENTSSDGLPPGLVALAGGHSALLGGLLQAAQEVSIVD